MRSIIAVLRAILPGPLLGAYHWALACLAAVGYGFPSRSLTVIGVTGTDGKTTVVHLLHEMLAAAGHRVGSLSSLRFKICEREEPNFLKMTMPGRFRLQKFLAECRAAGCRVVVIEVTSQGIAQFRHRFIRFQAAVLTNVTPEHIESHGGFENYRAEKMKLFQGLPAGGVAVLNREDVSAELFSRNTSGRVVWYSRSAIHIEGRSHLVRTISASSDGIQLEVGAQRIETALGGEFNVMNILAGSATAMAFGAPLSAVAEGARRVSVMPGRLEFVVREPFAVVVDYANTPAAYERVYQTLAGGNSKLQTPNSKLICVFGAPGGGRDKWKRPEIGKIASRYCKEIILTSDDPDDENPLQIMEEIKRGFSSNSKFQISNSKKIVDRREAIRMALRAARPGDTVIITGMGAQPWLIVKGKKIPWDDRKIAREELARLEH